MYCMNRAGLQVLLPDLYRVNMPVKVTGALQQEFDELILRFALRPGRHCAPSACTWAQHAVTYGAARRDTRAPSHLALVYRTVAHALSVLPWRIPSMRMHCTPIPQRNPALA